MKNKFERKNNERKYNTTYVEVKEHKFSAVDNKNNKRQCKICHSITETTGYSLIKEMFTKKLGWKNNKFMPVCRECLGYMEGKL